MLILALETSCDETAVALVKNGVQILAQEIASSLPLHAKTGGIIPETAARQQLATIIPLVKKMLQNASACLPTDKTIQEIDAIAVTTGPGLIGSLLVGIETAKTLALIWQKKLIAVNHLQAHLFANWLEKEPSLQPPLPALGLIVSGGHTDLVYINKKKQFRWLGGTRDDAAGECFDKTARLIGLSYPGGPSIQKAAKENHRHLQQLFPRPMSDQKNFDFSFSGLKTAVYNTVKKHSFDQRFLAAEIQEAIAESLVIKTLQAVDKYRPGSLLIGGGVAANQRLRNLLKKRLTRRFPKTLLYIPSPKFCTDNAAAIAAAAFHQNQVCQPFRLMAQPGLEVTK